MGVSNDLEEDPSKDKLLREEYTQTVIVQVDRPILRSATSTTVSSNNKKDIYSYEEIEQRIEMITGFKIYDTFPVKLNKEKKKIKGLYFQFDRGCILYALINEGWVDEKYIPDSMKYYKNHTYTQDTRNFKYSLLIKLLSLLDLAHLWTNLGGLSPYIEIDVEEAKKRIFKIIGRFFATNDLNELKKAYNMSRQKINYFTLIGNLNVKIIRFKDIDHIKDNPTIKKAIETKVIKEEDILVVGYHFFSYNGIILEKGVKAYSFTDSISNFYKTKKDEILRKSDCIIYDNDGKISAFENCLLLNKEDSDEEMFGKLEII